LNIWIIRKKEKFYLPTLLHSQTLHSLLIYILGLFSYIYKVYKMLYFYMLSKTYFVTQYTPPFSLLILGKNINKIQTRDYGYT